MLLRAAEGKSSVMPTRNNNRRKPIYVSRALRMKQAEKNHIFFSVKMMTLYRPPEHNLVVRENIHSLNKQHFGTS